MIIQRTRGFTLIELMIVVAVIGILSAIAYPSYSDYVRRSRIADATSQLADFRVKQERFFQDNRTYALGAGCGVADFAGNSFNYSCLAPDDNTYVATATGVGAMAGFTFTINQGNARTTTSPWVTGTVSCWVSRRGESC